MTDLDKAARDASEALGMSIDIQTESDEDLSPVGIDVFAAIDSEEGEMPVLTRMLDSRHEALALLEGLEVGARIANVRHGALVKAARGAYEAFMTLTSDEFSCGGDKPAREALTAALKELEDK
ncbi:MAG: hypothetical protein KOO60_10885 [Gemmatimonadales bacterium]|nr:hypothetical protein [Gemmatimonadales bacterium]